MATYGVALSYTLIMDLAQLMGAPLFKTNGWTQSNCFSSQTLSKSLAWAITIYVNPNTTLS